jgi:hypothetical protein
MREAIAAPPHYMQIKNIVMSCRTDLDSTGFGAELSKYALSLRLF